MEKINFNISEIIYIVCITKLSFWTRDIFLNIFLVFYLPPTALENTLEMGLEDLERSVKSVIDLQHAAASATRDHTQKLRQAMELQGDVCILPSCII